MAVEALWILELASQRGFRERGLPHVSAPGNPGGIDGARILDSLRTYAGPSERSEPAPGTESVRSSLEPREIGLARALSGPRNRASGMTKDQWSGGGAHVSLKKPSYPQITTFGVGTHILMVVTVNSARRLDQNRDKELKAFPYREYFSGTSRRP
jgi:hypothetical protein